MAGYSETFTGADAALGSATIDQDWTDVVAGYAVAGNAVALSSTGAIAYARAEVDVGASDMFAEATLSTKTDAGGDFTQFAVLARYSASENTCYMVCRGQDSADDVTIRKTVSGSRSNLAATTLALDLPEVVRIEVEGSTIRALIDGVEVLSTTDPGGITTGQRAGIYGFRPSGGAVVADDFAAGLLGTDYTDTLTDDLGVTDALTAAAEMERNLADDLGVTDALAQAAAFSRTPADDLGLSDAVVAAAELERTLTDDLGLADSAAAAQGWNRELVDELDLVDALAQAAAFGRELVDELGLVDALAQAATFGRTLVEQLGLADSVTGSTVPPAYAQDLTVSSGADLTAAPLVAAAGVDLDVDRLFAAAGENVAP